MCSEGFWGSGSARFAHVPRLVGLLWSRHPQQSGKSVDRRAYLSLTDRSARGLNSSQSFTESGLSHNIGLSLLHKQERQFWLMSHRKRTPRTLWKQLERRPSSCGKYACRLTWLGQVIVTDTLPSKNGIVHNYVSSYSLLVNSLFWIWCNNTHSATHGNPANKTKCFQLHEDVLERPVHHVCER